MLFSSLVAAAIAKAAGADSSDPTSAWRILLCIISISIRDASASTAAATAAEAATVEATGVETATAAAE